MNNRLDKINFCIVNRAVIFFLVFTCQNSWGTQFFYPKKARDSLIGNNTKDAYVTTSSHKDTLLDIARKFDIGQNEIILANPTVDRWLPGENTKVIIPNNHLLPKAPHDGLILNLSEYRLYFFSSNQRGIKTVTTHPMSIGRVNWDTPLGKTKIVAKTRNPVWIPPKSIRDEHAADGDILPDIYPAGPDNPLGLFALRLGVPGYLIHSTNKPYGVGMRVSHGCIRMYPEDIKKLFPRIKVGTPVYIVNQIIKVGWSHQTLYIEVHPNLEGREVSYNDKVHIALDLIEESNNGQIPFVNSKKLKQALQQMNGIPVAIYR